ncbi:MAG TPA: M91 family zinc metallopeptidase [Pilimelia sp.]|nr:M91 family zinc metallopeptidase [Pilimelia sp.]
MTQPDPHTMENIWYLAADPQALHQAARQWRTFATAAGGHRDAVGRAAAPLVGDAWSGDTADTYHDHLKKLSGTVTDLVTNAQTCATNLASAGDALIEAQHALNDSLGRTGVPTGQTGTSITFQLRNDDDVARVNTAITEAGQIRGALDMELRRYRSTIDGASDDVRSLASSWRDVAEGNTDGWTLPPEAKTTRWIYDGDSVVLNTGPGDDKVTVTVDPRTGEQIVTVNGETVTFPPGYDVTIRAGQGNDTVDVTPGTRVHLTLLGGEGDDTLRGGDGTDRILGLDGRDLIDGRGGEDLITAGATRRHLPGEDLMQPVVEQIDGGEGNDRLYGGLGNNRIGGGDGTDLIEGGAGQDTLDAGEGDDTVRGGSGIDNVFGRGGTDVLDGGADRDYVDGGAGDDTLTGGLGDDTLYGLSGNDTLDGGAGRDYLEGGTGDDALAGGAGNDMLSGGRGNDVIRGGTGDDVSYAGAGRDAVDGGNGNDTAYLQQNEDHTANTENAVNVQISDQAQYIKITGSPEFVERVQADLDLLRSSPDGQRMLGALQRAHDDSGNWFYDGNGLTIKELTAENGTAAADPGWFGKESYEVAYNPSFDTLHDGPPVTILYHELAHVYDYSHDTLADGDYTGSDNPGVPNRERAAAGLPIDDDNNPATPNRIDPDHPYDLTENGLREELGAPHRPRY